MHPFQIDSKRMLLHYPQKTNVDDKTESSNNRSLHQVAVHQRKAELAVHQRKAELSVIVCTLSTHELPCILFRMSLELIPWVQSFFDFSHSMAAQDGFIAYSINVRLFICSKTLKKYDTNLKINKLIIRQPIWKRFHVSFLYRIMSVLHRKNGSFDFVFISKSYIHVP